MNKLVNQAEANHYIHTLHRELNSFEISTYHHILERIGACIKPYMCDAFIRRYNLNVEYIEGEDEQATHKVSVEGKDGYVEENCRVLAVYKFIAEHYIPDFDKGEDNDST